MSQPPIVRGTCYASYAFELGHSIDLDRSERLLASSPRQAPPTRQRSSAAFAYRPAPVTVTIGPTEAWPRPAEIVLYDFGAATVSLGYPFDGPYEALPSVSRSLRDDPQLEREARARVTDLLTTLGGAVHRPRLADIVEDYFVFAIASPAPPDVIAALTAELALVTTQVLRPETGVPSVAEIGDTLSGRMSLTANDICIVDWNAALVWDTDADQIRSLLEFANVQLLELRHLDDELDNTLDQSYGALGEQNHGLFRMFRSPLRRISRLTELQVDSAILFARVTNALKLVGDQYLSRLYRLISDELHLNDWDQTIARKLQAIDGIYGKLSDRATTRRLELLEWIVIILIATEIVLSVR